MRSAHKPYLLALGGMALVALAGCGGAGDRSPGGCFADPILPSGREVLCGIADTAFLTEFIALTIDPGTGALTRLPVEVPPILCSGGIVAVGVQFLYISLPLTEGCPPGVPEIFGFALDQTTGAPTALAGSPFSLPSDASPHGLAAVPNSHFLYVADGSRIDAFAVDSVTGVPTAIAGSPFASGESLQLAVDPSGKFLYASDDDPPGGVLAFTIDSGGALTSVPGSPFTIPGQTVPNSRPTGIVDTGRFVYTALTASNQIAGFSIDSGTGALAPVAGSPFPAGSLPAVLAMANSFLYAVNEHDGSISGYGINSVTGVLTPLRGSPFARLSSSATLAADTSGKFLYDSTTVGIQGYSIDACTGALTAAPGSSGSIDGSLWMTVVQFPSPAAQ
ncbi:MAG: hypothetical protein DMG22_13920 [Acidobacteria bacterium]|nr:MAG: hypothetical protein DMG22_13920 [Acidobacteriota bacterium]